MTSNTIAESNRAPRGLLILVARLTAREDNRFFYLATTLPQRNSYEKMNLATWEEAKWQD
jgi:hypothetical protein